MRKWVRQGIAIALGGCFLLFLLMSPVIAQQPETASIIIDGQPVFRVSDSGSYSAQQRATEANQLLEEIISRVNATSNPIPVEIDSSKELPVIRVDGSHLLTVTSQDTPRGRTIVEQALVWSNDLEQAIRQAQYERTPSYLIKAGLISLAVIIIAFFLSWNVGIIWRRWIQPKFPQLAPKTLPSSQPITGSQPLSQPTPFFSLQLGIQFLLFLVRSIIWVAAGVYISRLFPQTRELSYKLVNIINFSLFEDIFPLGNQSYSVFDFLILIGLLVGLILATRAARILLKTRILSLTGLSRGAQDTIALIANYSLIFLGTIVILQVWGLDLSSLTVFASVLGVGLGLGLQGIAKEFVSGLVLIFERPIKVGDFVEVGGLMGTVERISVRSTEIRTLDQVSVILPNSRFLESEVVNWSHFSPISRLKVSISVAYGSDLQKVRQLLIQAAQSHPEVLSHPTPQVFFAEFGESSLKFYLLVWISRPYRQFQIKSDLYFQIDALFRENAVEIPFPQRDLHLRSGQLPVSPQILQSLTDLSEKLAQWLDRH